MHLMVSVVIPTYNRGNSLSDAIGSTLAQTVQPLEVIVVDDASTDGTEDVVARIAERSRAVPVRYHRMATNRGGGVARNHGVALARAPYVAFLDSDDVWLSTKLEEQLALARATKALDHAVVYSPVRIEKARGTIVLPVRAIQPGERVGDYLFVHDGLIQTSTLLLPTALARTNPIDPDLRRHQDFHLCLSLERSGAVFVSTRMPLATWSIDPHGDRVSHNPSVAATDLFLERYGGWLSAEALSAFLARVRAPLLGQSGKRVAALRAVGRALQVGVIDGREAIQLALRSTVPANLQARLRKRHFAKRA